MKKRKAKTKTTFSKTWINRIMWVCLLDMQLPFVLALLDKTEIAETLAVAIVTEVIGVFCGYMAKSYFETKAEKRQAFEYHVFDSECKGADEEDQ